MNISPLKQLYNGFYIQEPIGNNAFSFERRKNKSIYVPPLQEGDFEDLGISKEVAFSEVNNNKEVNRYGLKGMVYVRRDGKDIFIFDNHNHAFFFWMAGLRENKFSKGCQLVHVDQHKDTREPASYLDAARFDSLPLKDIFDYTNHILNVGNFIVPALKLGIFGALTMVDHSQALQEPVKGEYVLDLDMDFFSPEMEYIEHDVKVERLRELITGAAFITVATSPYFMDQPRALAVLDELFNL